MNYRVERSKITRVFLAISALLAAPSTVSGAERDTAPPLRVEIVPHVSSVQRMPSILLWESGDHFHVVLTNISKRPVRLWREWCSWGYFNLSLESRDREGKTLSVSKRERDWDRNYPDWMELLPGDSTVFNVGLEPKVWMNSPIAVPAAGKTHKAVIRLRAVYNVRDDEDARREGVWVGRVSSPEIDYQFTWSDSFVGGGSR